MGKLDSNSSRPPYLQIARDLSAQIASGKYRPGDRLPGYDALAEEYGVAIGTAKSAINHLREQAVVVTRHGVGTFVHEDLDPASLSSDGGRTGGLTEVLRLLNEINDRLVALERRLPTPNE
jgi:DNA-binding GntR family transcriptional regulator